MTYYIKIVFSILILVIIIYQQIAIYKLKKDKKKLRLELSEFQLHANFRSVSPHFIYNILGMVDALLNLSLYNDSNISNVKNALRLFGGMNRKLSDNDFLHTLKEELDFTDKYIQLEKYLHSNKFEYEIECSSTVNYKAMIPKTLIQLFVNNALKHGVFNIDTGKIEIKIIQISKNIEIKIIDNGIGLEESKKRNSYFSRGTGIAFAEKTTQLINAKYSKKWTIDFISSIKTGTVIILNLTDDIGI